MTRFIIILFKKSLNISNSLFAYFWIAQLEEFQDKILRKDPLKTRLWISITFTFVQKNLFVLQNVRSQNLRLPFWDDSEKSRVFFKHSLFPPVFKERNKRDRNLRRILKVMKSAENFFFKLHPIINKHCLY